MGHSQAEKLATHAKIVDVAARRFRELGIEGISVADIMKEAGLTVGGFYKHFASRDDLVIEALSLAFKDLDTWEGAATVSLSRCISGYLSESHRNNVSRSCPLSSLVNDVARSNVATREAYTARVSRVFDVLEKMLPPALAARRRAKAMVLFSACMGAISVSRAISDENLSAEILEGVASELIDLYSLPKVNLRQMAEAS
ncbi:TetR/AcrR family transcriptional regulator [Caballeronia sp. dw_19]|jgi:TetR/AcrR family transcriptional repressor of nem operon|uniref:TetR/AcrR family transcriptional regulator n=1 Tax=unclassified Caballeronia TaxID=2646786 RepID=UPI001BD2C42B|nr:TetR/AcrR family transcriptional regulator [Caballeronia sp. dw_19]